MNSKNGKKLSKKEKLKERIFFFMNLNLDFLPVNKKKTKQFIINNNNEETIPKNSIKVQKLFQKNNHKNVTQLLRINNFEKISPKFNPSSNIESDLNIEKMGHQITPSDLEQLKIEENISIKRMEQIESKSTNNVKISNSFPFHFLNEIEKCYQEISKDLKGNGRTNIEYKIRISASYLKTVFNEENIIYKYYLENKDFNRFFIVEFCIFLTIFFFERFF